MKRFNNDRVEFLAEVFYYVLLTDFEAIHIWKVINVNGDYKFGL